MNEDKNILCVDDNADNNELLKFFFELEGYRVTICTTAEECLDCIKNNEFAAIVIDCHLPYKDGIEVLPEIKETIPQIPIVFFTADARKETKEMAFKLGADAYLVKPDDLENLVSSVTHLIEANQLKVDNSSEQLI